ncbi:hypothetical protein [Burkholderia gladioli]|uniref:hypothetical protein n=1 Tax=Burkholderia gladioli TaxID=28095 RepID=UPI001C2539DD|nr:hypothetical protein [Burkholderia gladioli]MBU9378699.1 hypothetical protein [Burkholderia gladioli]
MTVASAVYDVTHDTDGSTVTFPIPFYFLANAHIVANLIASDGVLTPLVFGTDFDLSGAGDAEGGTLTTLVVEPAGYKLHIFRSVPVTQETQYQQNDAFPAKTTEKALDKLTMIAQQNTATIGRALQYPLSDIEPNPILPKMADRRNKGLGFDNAGNPFAIDLTIGAVTAPVVNSINMLRLVTVATPVFVTSYHGTTDGWGGGDYQPLPPTDTRPDNGGTIIRTANGIGFELQHAGVVSASQFGSLADWNGEEGTDNAVAIDGWLGVLSANLRGHLDVGMHMTTARHQVPALNYLCVGGSGMRQSRMVYAGAATTGDLLTFGDGVTSVTGLNLSGFMVDSATTMTAGTGIRIKKHQAGGNVIRDVGLGESDSSRKLWDGIWFDNVNVVRYDGFDIKVQNEGVIVNGTATTDEGSDLYLDHGFILGGVNLIHCAGGFGGLYLGDVLAYGGSGVSMQIDQARANRTNREIILSSQCVLDGATQALLRIYNPGGILIVDCNAFLSGAGFFGGTTGDNIDIQSMPLGRLTIGSSHIKSAKRHGINIEDNAAFISISDKTMITDCGGWGIYSVAPTNNVQNQGRVMFNTLGNIHPNVNAFVQIGTGIGATTGTITTSSGTLRYRLIGGKCECYSELTITTNGTGSGALLQTLPFPMKNNCIGHGMVTTNGKVVSVRGNAVDVYNVTILNYDGSYPAADGAVIRTWITYEVQN